MQKKENLRLFSERFSSSGGVVHHASSKDGAASEAVRIVSGRKGRIHVAQHVRGAVLPHLNDAGLGSPPEKSTDDYGPDDSGITEAKYGVAEAGCIVEVADVESIRLASSATEVHVALLRSSGVIASLSDLAGAIRSELFIQGRRPVITLISGPSRTSDIELKDVIGVHGPREVQVVIYEAEAQ